MKPIFACAILGHSADGSWYITGNHTHKNGCQWCWISGTHFRVCNFGGEWSPVFNYIPEIAQAKMGGGGGVVLIN